MKRMRLSLSSSVALFALAGVSVAQPCQTMWTPSVEATPLDGSVLAIRSVGAGVIAPGVYVAGAFTTVGGAPRSHIALWDGNGWSSLGAGLNNQTFALQLHQGFLFAAGRFTSAGVVQTNRVARWDGAEWSALGAGLDADAFALTTFDSGAGADLIAAGVFTTAGGAPARGVARWSNGQWNAMGTGLQGGARSAAALAVHDDGSGLALYAGGSFLGAGGMLSPNVARWNGLAWSALGAGLNGVVRTMAVFNGVLVAGGDFTASGAALVSHLAQWTGAAWTPLTTGANGPVTALHVVNAPAGQLLIAGGAFSMIGSTAANNLAVFDGQVWSALGAGVDSPVRAIEADSDGWWVGALALTQGGVPAQPIKQWIACLTKPGDLNGDGVVNSADLATPLTQWGQTGVNGDINGDDAVNSADLATLLTNWG